MSISHEEILDLLNADPISFDSKLRVLNERFSQSTSPQPAESDVTQPQQVSEQAPPADEAEARLRERDALREAQPNFDEQGNLTFEGRIRDYALQQKEVPPAEGIVTSISRGLGRGINTITKDLPGTAYEMTTGKESEYFRQARIDETVSYKAPEGGFIENLTSGNLSGLADNVSYTLANSLPSMAVGLGARAALLALGPYGLAANIAMGVSFFATASLPEVYVQGREQAGLAPGEGAATTLGIAAAHAAAESVGTAVLLKTLGSSAYSRAAMTPGAYARTLKRYGGSAAFVGAAESIEEAAQGGLELLRNNLAGKEYTAGEVGYHLAESALGGFLVGNVMGLGTAVIKQLRTGTKERSTEELADAHARAAGNQAKPDSDVDNVVRQWAQQAEAAGIINDETTLQERIGLHVLGSGIATERGLDAEAARSYVPTAYEADVIDYFASNQAELVPEVVSLLGKTGDVRFGEITGLNDPQQAVLLTALGAGHSIEANQTSLLPDWVSKLLVPRDSGLGKPGYVLPKQYRQLGSSLPLVQARQNAALFEGIKFRELPNFSTDPSKPDATNIAEDHARNDPLSFVVLDGFSVNKTGLPVAKFTSITAEEAVKQGLTTQKELDDYRTNKGLKLLTDMQEKLASELLNRATNAVNAQTQQPVIPPTETVLQTETQPTETVLQTETQPQAQPTETQPQLVNYTGQSANVYVDAGSTPIETSNALFDKLKQLVPNRDEAEQQAKAVAELLNDPQLAATLDSDLADKLVGALNGNGHKTAANQISRVLEAARAAKAELASIPGRQVKAELVKWGASQLHRNTSFINTTEADTAQLTTAANKVAGLMSKMRATDEDVIKLSEDADVQVLLENLPELKRINPLGTMGWLKRYEEKLTKLNEAVKRKREAAKDAGQAEKIAEAESQRQKAEADAVAQAADLLKQANERAAQNRQNSTERELSKLNKEQKRQLAERTRAEKKAINDEIALERDKLKTAKEKKNNAIDAEKADAASKREAAKKEIEDLQSALDGIKEAKTNTAKTKQRKQLLKKIQDKQEALEGITASSELTEAVTEAKQVVAEIEGRIATLEEAIATAQVRAAEQLKAERESAPVQQAEQITTRFSFPPTLMLVAESTKPLSDTENKLIAALITANNAQHRNRLGIVYKALSSDEKTHLASKEFDELIRDIKIVTANNIADKVVYTRFKRIYNTLRAYNVMDELGVPNIANNITNVAQFSLGVQGSEAYALVATDKNNNVVNHIIFNNQNKHVSLPQRDVSDIKVLRDAGGKLSLQEDKLVYSIGNKGLVLDISKSFKSQIKAAITAATEEAAIPTAEVVANTEEVTTPTAEVVADIEEEIALMDEDEWVTLTDEVLAADEKNIAELSVTKEQLEQNVAEAQAAYDRAVTHKAKLIATSQTDKAPEAPALAAQTDKAPEALALAAQTEPQNLIVQLQNEEMPVQERVQAAYARRSDLNNQIAYNTEVLRESGISLQDGVLSVDTSEFEFEDYGLARPKLTRANETTEEAQAEQAGFLANAPDEVKKAISSRVNEALAAISTAMAEVAEIDKTIASNEALHDQVLREVDEAKFRLELAQNELGNAEFVINRNIKQKTKYTYRLKLLRTRIAQRSSSQEPKASTLLSGRGELTYQQRFQQVYGSLEQSPELVEQGPNNVTLGVFKKHFGELLRAIDNADVSELKHMLGKTKQTDTNIANDAVTIKQHIVKTMLAYESVATTLNESEKSALAEHAIRLVWNPLLNRYGSLTSDTATRDSAIHHQRLLSAYQQLISPRGTLLKRISKWAAGNNALTDPAAITLRLGMAIEQNQFGEVFAQLDNNIRSAYVTFLHALSWKYPSLLNTRQNPIEKQQARKQKRAAETEGLAAQLALQETEFDVADIANLWQQARRSPTALVDSIASDYINPELQKIFGANLLEIKDKKGINRVSVTSQAALNEASAELEAAVAAMQKQLGELEASATPLISSEELEATRTAKDTAHQAISNKQWSTNYEALLSIYLLDEASVTEDQLSEAAESLTGLRREEIPVTMTNAENVASSLVSMLAAAVSQENNAVSPAHKLLLKGLLNAQVAYVNAHTPQPSVDYDKVQTLKTNIELLQESLAEARGEQQWSQALTEDSGYIRFEATLVSPRNIAAVAAHELLHKVLFTANNIGKGKVVISAEPLLKSIISAEAYQNYESSKNEISRVIIENKPALGEAQHASILEEEVVAHWISLNAPMLSLPDTDSKLAANWAGRGLGLAPDVNKSLLGARQLDSSTLSEITTLLQTKIEAAKPQATAIAEWLTKLDTLTEDTSIRDHMRLLQDEAHAQQYKVITSELPKGAIEHARQAKSRQAVIAAQALITTAAKIKQQEYADLVEAAKEAVANNEEQSAREIGQQLRTIEAVLKEYQKQLDLTNEIRIGSLAVTITPNKFLSGISGLFSQKHKATIGIDLLGRLLLIDHLQTHGGTYKSPTTWLGFTGRESELGILHMMMQDTVMKQLGLKARDTVTTEQPPLPPIASLTTYTRTVAPFAPAVFEGKTNVNGNIYLLEQPAALRIMLEELEAAQTPTTKFSKNVLPKNSGMTLAQAKSVIMRYFPQGERILNNVNLIEPGTNLTDVLIEKTNARITLADLKQITDSQGNIEGLFEPNSGQIFVLLSNVTEATLPGVILHEGSHKLGKEVILARKLLNKEYGAATSLENIEQAARDIQNAAPESTLLPNTLRGKINYSLYKVVSIAQRAIGKMAATLGWDIKQAPLLKSHVLWFIADALTMKQSKISNASSTLFSTVQTPNEALYDWLLLHPEELTRAELMDALSKPANADLFIKGLIARYKTATGFKGSTIAMASTEQVMDTLLRMRTKQEQNESKLATSIGERLRRSMSILPGSIAGNVRRFINHRTSSMWFRVRNNVGASNAWSLIKAQRQTANYLTTHLLSKANTAFTEKLSARSIMALSAKDNSVSDQNALNKDIASAINYLPIALEEAHEQGPQVTTEQAFRSYAAMLEGIGIKHTAISAQLANAMSTYDLQQVKQIRTFFNSALAIETAAIIQHRLRKVWRRLKQSKLTRYTTINVAQGIDVMLEPVKLIKQVRNSSLYSHYTLFQQGPAGLTKADMEKRVIAETMKMIEAHIKAQVVAAAQGKTQQEVTSMFSSMGYKAAVSPESLKRKARAIVDSADMMELLNNRLIEHGKLISSGYIPNYRYGRYRVYVNRTSDNGNIPMAEFAYETAHEQALAVDRLNTMFKGLNLKDDDQMVVTTGLENKNKLAYNVLTEQMKEVIELNKDSSIDIQNSLADFANGLSRQQTFNFNDSYNDVTGISDDLSRITVSTAISVAQRTAAMLLSNKVNKALNDTREWAQTTETDPNITAQLKQDLEFTARDMGVRVQGLANARMWMSVMMLGGSIAQGMVQYATLPTVTLPKLAQDLNSTTRATALLVDALNQFRVGKKINNLTPIETRLLAIGDQTGLISASNMADLYYIGNTGQGLVHKTGNLMMLPFSVAETHVRKAAFLAALRTWNLMTPEAKTAYSKYNTASQKNSLLELYKLTQPGSSGANVVLTDEQENQILYAINTLANSSGDFTRENRPTWAQGDVGATVFMFHAVIMVMLDHLRANFNRPAFYGTLVALTIIAGTDGWPGAENFTDIMNILIGIGNSFGLGLEPYAQGAIGAAMTKDIETMLEGTGFDDAPDILRHGVVNYLLGFDFAQKTGFGRIIPGTGLLNEGYSSERLDTELIGVSATFLNSSVKTIQALSQGNLDEALRRMPLSGLRQFYKASTSLAGNSEYRDPEGQLLGNLTRRELFGMFLGFEPAYVSYDRTRTIEELRRARYTSRIKSEIAKDLAFGSASERAKAISAINYWSEWNLSMYPSQQTLNRYRKMRNQTLRQRALEAARQ